MEISGTEFKLDVDTFVLFVIVSDAVFDASVDDGVKTVWCMLMVIAGKRYGDGEIHVLPEQWEYACIQQGCLAFARLGIAYSIVVAYYQTEKVLRFLRAALEAVGISLGIGL